MFALFESLTLCMLVTPKLAMRNTFVNKRSLNSSITVPTRQLRKQELKEMKRISRTSRVSSRSWYAHLKVVDCLK